MERVTETWVTLPERPVSISNRNACLVHIYPTGPGMGTRYTLGDTPLVLGRGSDCDIRINDHSVSRRHARIQPGADGYYAVDLQSTNGTFVNDVPASMCKLKDGDYLRVGNCIYRFLAGGNVEAEYHEEIYRLTIIDALTDIHNKRYLLEFLDRELARSARYNRPLSLIMFDIDRFKGSTTNLAIWAAISRCASWLPASRAASARKSCSLATAARNSPWCCRKRPARGALILLSALRTAIETASRSATKNRSYTVTISLGIATTAGGCHLRRLDGCSAGPTRSYTRPRTTGETGFAC